MKILTGGLDDVRQMVISWSLLEEESAESEESDLSISLAMLMGGRSHM